MNPHKVALLLVIFACVIWSAFSIHRSATLTAAESGQRALIREAYGLIERYYLDNGTFPDSLIELRLTFPDGGTANMVDDIRYEPSGGSYILEAVGCQSGLTIVYPETQNKSQ